MIQYYFLLLTRVATVIPIVYFIVKQIGKFRDPTRDMSLEITRRGIFIINVSMLTESTLFGAFDLYRIINEVPSTTPIFWIVIWCLIRVSLVFGIWTLFSVLFEKE